MGLKDDMGTIWVLFRKHWKQFLAIHLAANLLVFAVLGPLLSLVVGWVVLASGDAALTDQDILFYFLSPRGFLLLLFAAALAITVAVFESAANLVAGYRARQSESLGLWRLGRFMFWRLKDLFQLALRMLLKLVLLTAPFLVVAGLIFFRYLTEFDINYYLQERPPEFWTAGALIVVILLLMAVLLVRMLSGWVLALPLLLLGQGKPGEVLGLSQQLVAGHRRHLMLLLAVWVLVFAGLSALVSAVLDLGAWAAMAMAGSSLERLAWFMGGVVAVWSLLNFFVSLLAGVTLMLGILLLYERLAQDLPAQASRQLALLDAQQDWQVPGRWVLLGLVTVIVVAAFVFLQQLKQLKPEQVPEVMAHRGASWDATENTLAAIRAAIEQGADWVEIDVQETAEGNVVVMHDRDLMKVAGSPLTAFDAPLAELQAVDIGSWKDPKFSAERVPLFADVLALAKDRIKVNIELKYYGRETRLEERVAALVEQAGMEDQVVIMSLSLPGVRKMQQLRPSWPTGLLASVSLGDLTRLEVDFFAVNARFANRRFVTLAQERERSVLTWTVNDVALMSAMISKGVDGIITDRPGLAKEVIRQHKTLDPYERFLVQLASKFGSRFNIEQ